jgi:hypothetical protein
MHLHICSDGTTIDGQDTLTFAWWVALLAMAGWLVPQAILPTYANVFSFDTCFGCASGVSEGALTYSLVCGVRAPCVLVVRCVLQVLPLREHAAKTTTSSAKRDELRLEWQRECSQILSASTQKDRRVAVQHCKDQKQQRASAYDNIRALDHTHTSPSILRTKLY